jgi:protein TonB
MIARFVASLALGIVVTFALLFTMQLMIATGKDALIDSERIRIVDFVKVERLQTVETRAERPERPPEPERRPDMPRPEPASHDSGSVSLSMTRPEVDFGVKRHNKLGVVSDGEYLPIVKVAPVYPTRALARRLEGFVILKFTVTASGSVTDVAVVESSAELFEDPAIDAALKFKYKPRVIDGAPIAVAGVVNKIVFTMDSSQRVAMER